MGYSLLFPISSKDRIRHTTAFVTPVVEHWLEREIAQWVHPMKDRSDDPSRHERTLSPRSYISLLLRVNHSPMRVIFSYNDCNLQNTSFLRVKIILTEPNFHYISQTKQCSLLTTLFITYFRFSKCKFPRFKGLLVNDIG